MAIVSSWPTRSPQGQPFSSSVIGQGVLQHEGFGLEHLELPKRTGDRGEALPLQHVTGLSSTRWRAAPSDSRSGRVFVVGWLQPWTSPEEPSVMNVTPPVGLRRPRLSGSFPARTGK